MTNNIDPETKRALANFLGSTLRKTKELESNTLENSNTAKSPHDCLNIINRAAAQIENLSGPGQSGPPANYVSPAHISPEVLPIPNLIPMPEDMQNVEPGIGDSAISPDIIPPTSQTSDPPDVLPTTTGETLATENPSPTLNDPQLELPLTNFRGADKVIIDELDRINRKLDRILKYFKENETNNPKQS